MSGDSESVARTAMKLNMDEGAVRRALRVAEVYRGIAGNLKHERRLARHDAAVKRQIADCKVQYPDVCFCDREGLEVARGYEMDGQVDEIEIKGPYGPPYKEPRFRCTNCGRAYMRPQPAMA